MWGGEKPLRNRVEPYTFQYLYTEPYTAKTLIISIFSTIQCIECIECMVIFRKVSMEYILQISLTEVCVCESDLLYRVIETRKKPDPTTHRPPHTHPLCGGGGCHWGCHYPLKIPQTEYLCGFQRLSLASPVYSTSIDERKNQSEMNAYLVSVDFYAYKGGSDPVTPVTPDENLVFMRVSAYSAGQ